MGALNIKDADVAAKARKLAELTGKSITQAVSEALDQSLKAAHRLSEADRELRRRKTEEIASAPAANSRRRTWRWREIRGIAAAFDAGDHRLGGAHLLRDIGLRHARFRPGLDQRKRQHEFRLQPFVLGAERRVLHPFVLELLERDRHQNLTSSA